jgi:hypothetical protein
MDSGHPWPASTWVQKVEACGADEVSSWRSVGPPGCRMKPVRHRATHEPVPGGMEFDLVNAITVAIMCVQHGVMKISQPPMIPGGARACFPSEFGQRRQRRRVPSKRVGECGIAHQRIKAGQRRRLIRHVMRRSHVPEGNFHPVG